MRPIGYVPMLLWPEQEKAANSIGAAMDNDRDAGGEKSRDMGMTWIILACILRRFLRQKGFSALIGAMTDLLLDDEKNDATLFWKIDCMMKHLPAFLRPNGLPFNAFKKKYRSPADMLNPENGNTINGNAPTERFAVGARKSVVYFDDWGQWTYGAEAWESASATTNCRIASWTAKGMNHAYELAKSKGRFAGVRVKLVNIHWKTDPRKQKTAIDPYSGEEYNVWLREQIGDANAIDPLTGKRGITGRISMQKFLQDYEMQYELGDDKSIYALQMTRARKGKFPYDPRFQTFTFWDYGRTNRTAIVFAQFDHIHGRLRIIAFIEHHGEDIRFYPPLVVGRNENYDALPNEDAYTPQQKHHIERVTSWQIPDPMTGGFRVPYKAHYGDPTGENRTLLDKRSVVQILDEAGIKVQSRWDKDGRGYTGRIEDARWLLPLCDVDEEHAGEFIEHMNRYRFKDDDKSPVHDVHSDCATAFEYGAVNLRPLFEDWLAGKRESFQTKQIKSVTFDGLTPEQRQLQKQRERALKKAQGLLLSEEDSSIVYTLAGQRVLGGSNQGGGYADDW